MLTRFQAFEAASTGQDIDVVVYTDKGYITNIEAFKGGNRSVKALDDITKTLEKWGVVVDFSDGFELGEFSGTDKDYSTADKMIKTALKGSDKKVEWLQTTLK